jgi:hypothetical protein
VHGNAEGFREQGAGEGIWALEGRSNRGMENTIWRGVLCCAIITKYYSDDEVKNTKMGRTCSTYGSGGYRVLVGKPEGRRPHGRPSRRWEYNIKMDLREVGWRHGLDESGSG